MHGKYYAVLDTNVLVSALLGASHITFLTKLSSKTLLINSAKRIIKYAAVGLQSNVNDPVNRKIGEQASGNYLP